MSDVSNHCSFGKVLSYVDRVCDYVPFVSTVTNFVDIFEKCILSCCVKPETIENSHYFTHLANKSYIRCVILLIPVIGNLIIGIYDTVRCCCSKTEIEKNDRQLALDEINAQIEGLQDIIRESMSPGGLRMTTQEKHLLRDVVLMTNQRLCELFPTIGTYQHDPTIAAKLVIYQGFVLACRPILI